MTSRLNTSRPLDLANQVSTALFVQAMTSSTYRHILRPARRKRAHGPYPSAQQRPKPLALFIRILRPLYQAETISYNDYVSLNGEQGAKEAGKMRLEGKDYVVQDGDVMHFRFNN